MTSRAYAKGMFDACSRLGHSAILLDSKGQVLEVNDAAKAHLGGCIRVAHHQVSALDRKANDRLQALIANAGHEREPGQPGDDTFVILPRAGRRPVIAYASPIPSTSGGGIAGTMILLVSQEHDRGPDAALLQKLFSLTPAELRLVTALARGHDLQSTAALLKLSVGTLRVHLKSIFEKTNTGRQAELIWLLARLSMRIA